MTKFIFVILFVLFLTSCGNNSTDYQSIQNTGKSNLSIDPLGKSYVTPTEIVAINKWPNISDDLDFKLMVEALERQIYRYKNKNLKVGIKLGKRTYSGLQIKKSLLRFKELVKEYQDCLIIIGKKIQNKIKCELDLTTQLMAEYNMYRPLLKVGESRYGKTNFARFTSYYTPLLKGSFVESLQYPHAIYSKPSSLSLVAKTRVEIDFSGALKNKDLELFFTRDLYELYLLHIQGGGKVEVQGKSKLENYYISYNGTNRKSFNFISNYMYAKGYISNKSIAAQRKYLESNPDKQKEIYGYCPSYVYFKISQTPPEGSDSTPLTDGRSLATDRRHYAFKGLLAYVKAKRPKSVKNKSMKNFSRFFLDQDTGGAIKGKARVDLYHGEGSYAETAAYNTDVTGQIYFLVLK